METRYSDGHKIYSHSPQLMELLARRREAIIQKWMERVRGDEKIPSAEELDRFILRDDMPGILRQLIIAVGHHLTGTVEFDEAILRAAESEFADAHVESRLRHGYQLPEALREFGHLRLAIIDTWLEHGAKPSGAELKLLHAAIDELMVAAASQILDENLAAKDLFLSKLSHELNSPIMAIVSNLELLRSKENAPSDSKPLEAVFRNADILLTIAADLNDLSKIVLGKFRLRLNRTFLSSIITSIYEWSLPLAQQKQIDVSVEFNKDFELEVDETKIHQALVNLVNNAMKFTDPGGNIRISGEVNSDIQFKVTDDGPGISEQMFPTLFSWPALTKPEDPIKSGMGLGLPIVREIAELHGGQVFAENNIRGKGATFTLRLPLVKGH